MMQSRGSIRIRIGWIVALMLQTTWRQMGCASATAAPDEMFGNRGAAERCTIVPNWQNY